MKLKEVRKQKPKKAIGAHKNVWLLYYGSDEGPDVDDVLESCTVFTTEKAADEAMLNYFHKFLERTGEDIDDVIDAISTLQQMYDHEEYETFAQHCMIREVTLFL